MSDYIFKVLKNETETQINKIRNQYIRDYPIASLGYTWGIKEDKGKKILSNTPGKKIWGHPLTRFLNSITKVRKIAQLKQAVYFRSSNDIQIYNFTNVGKRKLLDYSYINNLTLKNIILPYVVHPKNSNITIINLMNFGSISYRPHLGVNTLAIDFSTVPLYLKDDKKITLETIKKAFKYQGFNVFRFNTPVDWGIVDNYFLGGLDIRKKITTYGEMEILEKELVKGERNTEGGQLIGTNENRFMTFWEKFSKIFPDYSKATPKIERADIMVFNTDDGRKIKVYNVPYISFAGLVFPLNLPGIAGNISYNPLSRSSVLTKFDLSGRFTAARTYNRAITYKNKLYQKYINDIKHLYIEAFNNLKKKLFSNNLNMTLNKNILKTLTNLSKEFSANKEISNVKEIEQFIQNFIRNIKQLRYESILQEIDLIGGLNEETEGITKELKEMLKYFQKEEKFEDEKEELTNLYKELKFLEENWWNYITDNIRDLEIYNKMNTLALKHLHKTIEDEPEWQYLSEELTAKLSEKIKELEKAISFKIPKTGVIKEYTGFKGFESILKLFSKTLAKSLSQKQGLYIKAQYIKNLLLNYSAGYLFHLYRYKFANLIRKGLEEDLFDLQNYYSLLAKKIHSEVYKTIYGEMIRYIKLAIQNALIEHSGKTIKKWKTIYETTGYKLKQKDITKTASPIFKKHIKRSKYGFYVDTQMYFKEIVYVNVINII